MRVLSLMLATITAAKGLCLSTARPLTLARAAASAPSVRLCDGDGEIKKGTCKWCAPPPTARVPGRGRGRAARRAHRRRSRAARRRPQVRCRQGLWLHLDDGRRLGRFCAPVGHLRAGVQARAAIRHPPARPAALAAPSRDLPLARPLPLSRFAAAPPQVARRGRGARVQGRDGRKVGQAQGGGCDGPRRRLRAGRAAAAAVRRRYGLLSGSAGCGAAARRAGGRGRGRARQRLCRGHSASLRTRACAHLL